MTNWREKSTSLYKQMKWSVSVSTAKIESWSSARRMTTTCSNRWRTFTIASHRSVTTEHSSEQLIVQQTDYARYIVHVEDHPVVHHHTKSSSLSMQDGGRQVDAALRLTDWMSECTIYRLCDFVLPFLQRKSRTPLTLFIHIKSA